VVLVFWTQVEGMGRTATEGLNEVFLLADGGMPLHEAWEKMKQPTSYTVFDANGSTERKLWRA
jgi:hypothetical protein